MAGLIVGSSAGIAGAAVMWATGVAVAAALAVSPQPSPTNVALQDRLPGNPWGKLEPTSALVVASDKLVTTRVGSARLCRW